MVRSILLRGFDQDFADRIGTYMAHNGVGFIPEAEPLKLERPDPNGRIFVTYKADHEHMCEDYDTVLFAIGR